MVDFIQKWPNLCSASWNTIFFSRNQNCCNISPWASNKENLEYVVQYQKVICNLKIFSARSIFFGFCPNLFWYCKRKKNMYLINETTHCFRLPNIMLKMTFRKWNWPRLKLLCLSNTILNWTKTDFAFLIYFYFSTYIL